MGCRADPAHAGEGARRIADWLLQTADVLVVDTQSTGASPDHGSLLEIGWAVVHPAPVPQEAEACTPIAHWVELPAGARIPRAVSRITGITRDAIRDPISPAQAWRDVSLAASQISHGRGGAPAPTVIHFARFEEAFLRRLHQTFEPERPWPFDLICTHAIARRLLPDLPRRSIRAVAGYFGFPVDQLRRSAGHVAATAWVWRHVVELLRDEHAIETRADLGNWLQRPALTSRRRVYPMDRSTRLALPDSPGVYRMLRGNGDVLYVGKAVSLKRRVNSYFQKQRRIPERTLELLSQVRDVSVTPTESALEAAILESDLIKEHAPPYNVALQQQARSLWFYDTALEDAQTSPDDGHRVGPVSSRQPLWALGGLRRALAAEGDDPSERVRHSSLGFSSSFPGGPRALDRECYREGLRQFRAEVLEPRCASRTPSSRALARVGARLWLENLQTFGRGRVEPEERAEELDEVGWEPADVTRALTEVLLDAAHAVRRARWLMRLSESCVAWREPGEPDSSRHLLVVDRGRIVERRSLSSTQAVPSPPGEGREALERQRSFDLSTCDRLRVLTTELRRVVTAEPVGEAELCLRAGRVLSTEGLVRVLAWV